MNGGLGTRLTLAHNQATISFSLHLDFSAVARAVCDVTARYASHWCTHVRKQRLNEPWWAETLAPLSPSREEKEEEEEDFLGKHHSLVCPASPFNVGGISLVIHILENGHAISLVLQNVYVATLFKLLGWAGRPAPCALRVSNQSGRSYSTVAMEYANGKISARGREISWLNHPCYLGYKGEVGYKCN